MYELKNKEEQIRLSNEEDYSAIRSVLDGNLHSFKLLQKKYKRIISTLIRKMIKDEDDVEDLTQETFIKAYKSLSSFQFGYSFSSWLYRIASNSCIDFLRKKRFQTVSISQPANSSNDDDSSFDIEDSSYQPEINFMNNERKQALIDAINQLPDNYKLIIKLRHDEDLDYNQISERLSLPLGTVKAHIFRARKILLNSLQKKLYLFDKD